MIKKSRSRTPCFFTLIFLLSSSFSYGIVDNKGQPDSVQPYAAGELIVKFKPQSDIVNRLLSTADEEQEFIVVRSHPILSRYRMKQIEKLFKIQKDSKASNLRNIYKITLEADSPDVLTACRELRQSADIEYCEPNYKVQVASVPSGSVGAVQNSNSDSRG